MPPILAMGAAVWAACALFLGAARSLDAGACLAAGAGAALALVALLALFARKGARPALLALAGALLGVSLAAGQAAATKGYESRAHGQEVVATVRAVEDARDTDFGRKVLASVCEGPCEGALVSLLLDDGAVAPLYGQAFEVRGRLSAPGAGAAEYLWRQGCALQLKADRVRAVDSGGMRSVVLSVRSRAVERLCAQGGEGAAVSAALACGYRRLIGDGLDGAFKATGLSHLVAVSGAHLSLVAAFCAALLRLARCPRPAAIVAQAAVLLAFLVLSGGSPSTVRALVMAFCALGSFFARRRPSALAALGACIVGFVAADPFVALSASFALSALSTLGIVVFSGLVGSWLRRCAPHMPSFARDALALTLCSGLATAPYAGALFAQASLVGPLANVAASLLFAPACVASVVSALVSGLLDSCPDALVGAGALPASALAAVARALSSVPFASVPVDADPAAALALSGALCCALYGWWPQPGLRRGSFADGSRGFPWSPPSPRPRSRAVAPAACLAVAALALVAVLAAPADGSPSLTVLDVGQGDAILVRGSAGAVLVDTGNQPALLRRALARNGVAHLDAVVVTHSDDDHRGCLADLAGVVSVDRVLVGEGALSCSCASCGELRADAELLVGRENLTGLPAGARALVGDVSLAVLWPLRYEEEGGNADSLCLLASFDADGDGAADYRALLTGDAERQQLSELKRRGELPEVDVLKVGHHGSRNALDAATLEAMGPRVALISCGANNRYGHPSDEALDLLAEAGARVLRTDESGDVACRFAKEGVRVETGGK